MANPAPRFSAPLSPAEIREFTPFMHELIGVAFGVVRPRFLTGTRVMTKADASPVTAADRGAEEAMRSLIQRRYPQHGVLGEEYGSHPGNGRYRWILDPVDGTRAFISNCFLFGTLIALERDDGEGFRPVLGCIAHAAAGQALIGHGRESWPVCRGRRPATRPGAALPAHRGRDPPGHQSLDHRRAGRRACHGGADPARQALSDRGDCFGYFALATGGADIMLDPTLSYWDVAAIVPVVEGAGGRVSAWNGGDPLANLSLIATRGRTA